jgi:hypothetical protein
MLRLYRIIGVVFLLLALGSVVAAIYDSSTFQACISNNSSAGGANQQKKCSAAFVRVIRCSGGFIDQYKEAITAFSTLLIALFTLTLWISTSGTLKLARDEFNSTYRPEIRIKHLWLANDIWQGEPIVINLWCVNNGTSDAILHDIGVRYHVVRTNRALPIEPQIPSIPRFEGSEEHLPTGRNLRIPNINIGRVLTTEENSDIQQGRSKLYCVGDAAKRMRITGFCRVLKFPPDAFTHVGNCRFMAVKDPDYEYED